MAVNYKIVNDIVEHVDSDSKSNWYVGIATHPRNRLFIEHNVSEYSGKWIYNTNPMSEIDARDTEKHLLDNYSFRGGPGGGDHPQYLYAYKITPWTKQ